MHNTCEDSLLATPLIIDLIVLCEVCERISVKCNHPEEEEEEDKEQQGGGEEQEQEGKFHSVLSVLSYLLKAPLVPAGTPVVNALGAQRQCIVNIFRACIGLPPIDYMHLEHKVGMY
jgi:myo-inositol-1-phosphate synthase